MDYPNEPLGLPWGGLSWLGWDLGVVSWDAGDPGFESHRCIVFEPFARLRGPKSCKPLESDTRFEANLDGRYETYSAQ